MGKRKGRIKYSKNIYKDEFANQVYSLRALNLSNKEIAKYFNIDEATLRVWVHRYPEFKAKYYMGNPNSIKIRHFNTSEKLLNEIDKALRNNDLYKFVDKLKSGDEDGFSEDITEVTLTSINNKKLIDIVNAFEKLQKAQRQTLGIVDDDKLTRKDRLKEHADKLALEEKRSKQNEPQSYDIKIGFEDEED